MGGQTRKLRHRVAAAAVVAGALVTLAPGAAHADTTVVVPGTAFPAESSYSTYLTYFGCQDLYHADTRGPAARVILDEAAPLGRRATELAMPGAGTASGAVSLVDSVAQATHELTVRASAGTSGVAWVWYLAPGMAPGEVWSGRAALSAAGDGWQRLDAASAAYTWTRVEAATGAVREAGGTATIDDFAATHGDGPGYLLAGLGCDGRVFGVDAVRVGLPGAVTTFDLEGWAVGTSAAASAGQVAAGDEVTLTGRSTDAAGRPMGASLVLEAKPAGQADFRPVTGDLTPNPDGTVSARVKPEQTTDYRWFFAERSYADAHVSPVVRVVVTPAEQRR